MARTFQITAVFTSMTVRENVQVALQAHYGRSWRFWQGADASFRGAADRLLAQVEMGAQADRAAGVLAYGDLKRAGTRHRAGRRPTLLLMDEPTAGMAAAERTALMALVRRLADAGGLAVLFTEHDMDVVFGVADRILVLDRGRLIAAGAPGANSRRSAVRESLSGHRPLRGRQTHAERGQPVRQLWPRARSQGVSFHAPAGEVLVLLGRNGAGKSTTLKSVIGLVRPAAGWVVFNGRDVAEWETHRIARAGLGYVPEERRMFSDLTVTENLLVGRQQPRESSSRGPRKSCSRCSPRWPHARAAGRAHESAASSRC